MKTLWWETTDYLYDRECRLFYRYGRYIAKTDGSGQREKNGEKFFWAHGNGWIMAGIVQLPADGARMVCRTDSME